jgi:hypothetical protein
MVFIGVFWLHLYYVQPLIEDRLDRAELSDFSEGAFLTALSLPALWFGYWLYETYRPKSGNTYARAWREVWDLDAVERLALVWFVTTDVVRAYLFSKGALVQGSVSSLESSSNLNSLEKLFGQHLFSSGAGGNSLIVLTIVLIVCFRQISAGYRSKRSVCIVVVMLVHEFVWSAIGGWRSYLPIAALLCTYVAHKSGIRMSLLRLAGAGFLLYLTFVPLRPILQGYRVGIGVLEVRDFREVPDLIRQSLTDADQSNKAATGLDAALENLLILDAHRNLRSFVEIVPTQVDWYFGKTIFYQLLRYPLQWLDLTDNPMYLDTGVQNWLFRDLGVIPPNETASFLTTPFHGELYINFGILFVPALMLLGFTASWLWGTTNSRNVDATALLEILFFYYIIYQGSYYSIGTLVVLLVTKAVFVIVVLRILGRQKVPLRAAAPGHLK